MLRATRIPGYELHEVISESASKLIIRAFSHALQKSVVLKVLKPNCPIDAVTRLKHEYRIASSLAKAKSSDIPGVVKVYSLVKQEDISFLVLEDFGGISLDKIIASQALDVVSCLTIAVQLATVLMSLHSYDIIHKDIKPSSIIVNQKTGEIKLTDFGIASFKEKLNASSFQLEGSFAYMSPEQTGRINRAVDYRSDFYSLGVTLYEMLAFRLPFISDDALELIHSHIAKQPPPLTTLPQLAAIVMKLMAKNAESRYQSAVGLLADLEFCLTQLKANGVIPAFKPGERDKAGQLSFRQKLYGRDKEVDTLLDAFARVSNGSVSSGFVLISGYSGIGKSALVSEIQQPVTRQRGYFIAGKFDHQRNIPYAAFFQAFESLMRILLVEDSIKLLDWRQKLQTALGDNGQIIVEVIPELELIIGEQPPVPQLSLNETQNRFHLIFRAFISVFAQKERPLVIFLDDLHFCDTASLLLIQQLATDNQGLLLIGAYRDNEVESKHALMQCVREIEKATKIVRLALEPLNLDQTIQLLCDTFDSDDNGELVQLASLLLNKTAGNPFLFTQIIKTLYEEGLIKYDFQLQHWKWNINQIQTVGITDLSVVELMVRNLIKLPPHSQELLKLAACIGERFNLTTLSIISETSPTEVTEKLSIALTQGLILPVRNSGLSTVQAEIHEYRFLHERVQQAAYLLIDSNLYEITHYKIGKLLLHQESEKIEENIFDIVNQFNLGISQIQTEDEAQELSKSVAELNLIAARKAKASLAFTAAAKYLHHAVQLLPVDSWSQYYDLTLNIYRERAEIEFLNGNFEFAKSITYTAIEKVSSLEKADFYNLIVSQYTRQARYDDVLKYAKNGLSLLDIYLPEGDCEDIACEELMIAKQNLDNIGIDSIVNLPKIENKQIEIAVKLLINLEPLVYTASNFTLYTFIVSKAVNLSLKYGNVSESVKAYANFGLIIGSKLGEYQSGYQLGLSAYELSEKLNDKSQKSKASALLTGWLHCWSKPIKNAAVISRKGYQAGLESGDLMFAGCNLVSLIYNLFFQGLALNSISKEILVSYQAAVKIQHVVLIDTIIAIKFTVDNLTNVDSEYLNNLEIYNYSITKSNFIKQCKEQQSFWSLTLYYVCQIQVLYLLNNQDAALDYINKVQQYLVAILGFTISSEYYFYYSLVLSKLYLRCDVVTQEKYLVQIHQNQQQLKIWAASCAENFLHKYLLVEAEIARITGKNWQAVDLYDKAIELAQKNGFIQNEALANELAALFWENQDKEDFSKIYITKAHRCYEKWGAKAKVKQLEKRYPYLVIDSNEKTITSSKNYSLDIATVVKASLALSRELIPSRLNTKLLHLVRENACAEKVYFIIKQNNQLIIESLLVGDSDDNTVWQRIAVTESYQLPVSLINYIERTQTYLVLDDASQSLEFNTDPYINITQPLSVLAVPIIHTGKMLGVLYLENNLVKGAFTSERVEILQILALQAAISLENARFYTTLEARVAERTKELETALGELNRTQIQLIQSEKMSGLGQLVAGIAHEINNPVSFIFGNLLHTKEYTDYLLELIKLYQNELPNPSSKITNKIDEIDLDFISKDLPQIIQSMHTGAKRIKDVVLSLRTFSRLDEATLKEVDIHQGIESTLMILQQKLGNIQVIKDYGDIPQVNCFAGEINQVILNILTNAIDALDVCSNSTIWIKTYLSQDNYIAIEIADNGIGMSQDILSKIFDPFFTTKPVGKGTGLGLSICYQIIVDKHQGKLTCTSVPNQGSKLTILLPR